MKNSTILMGITAIAVGFGTYSMLNSSSMDVVNNTSDNYEIASAEMIEALTQISPSSGDHMHDSEETIMSDCSNKDQKMADTIENTIKNKSCEIEDEIK